MKLSFSLLALALATSTVKALDDAESRAAQMAPDLKSSGGGKGGGKGGKKGGGGKKGRGGDDDDDGRSHPTDSPTGSPTAMCAIDSIDDILGGGNDVTLCVSTVDGDSCGSVRVIEDSGMCDADTEVEVDTLGGLMPDMRDNSLSPFLGDTTQGGEGGNQSAGCGIIDPQTTAVGFVWKVDSRPNVDDIISFGLRCDVVTFGPLMNTAAGPLPSVTTAGNNIFEPGCLPQSDDCNDGPSTCPSGQYLVGMGVANDVNGDDIVYIEGVCSGGDVITTTPLPSNAGPIRSYDCAPGMAIRSVSPWVRNTRARALAFECFPPLRPLPSLP